MTRDDVANLVIRTVALWLGVDGLGTLGSMPWMIEGPGGRGVIVAYAFVLLAAAAILWLAAAPLTRAMFARPDREVPFALSPRGVPALASFVTGLFVFAGAIPQAVSWVAMVYVRHTADVGVFGPSANDLLDQRSVGAGAEILARAIVGVALLALSRRPNFWPIPDTAEDAPIDEPEPPAA